MRSMNLTNRCFAGQFRRISAGCRKLMNDANGNDDDYAQVFVGAVAAR